MMFSSIRMNIIICSILNNSQNYYVPICYENWDFHHHACFNETFENEFL